MAPPTRPIAERFWEKVDQRGPDECWPWLAGRFARGYGQFRIKQGGRKTGINASRMAYILTHGDPGPEMQVCHTCDNPPCCNPRHLFVGTALDNKTDCVAKRRHVRGVRQHLAKLTPERVHEARRRARTESCASIAAEFGVSETTVGRAVRGETWKDA